MCIVVSSRKYIIVREGAVGLQAEAAVVRSPTPPSRLMHAEKFIPPSAICHWQCLKGEGTGMADPCV